MIVIKEVARLGFAGVAKKRIAHPLGPDRKMVRRYVRAAAKVDLPPGQELADEAVGALHAVLYTPQGQPVGSTRELCILFRQGKVARVHLAPRIPGDQRQNVGTSNPM